MIKLREKSHRISRFGESRTVSAVQKSEQADRDSRWQNWIERMAEGDAHALSALYDESSTILFGLVREILRDREAAEDALVEIYDHARREARKFDARHQTPLEWLLTLARNFAVERLRRTRDAAASHTTQDQFKHERLFAAIALARISDEQRSILEMTYLGGLTAREVAGVLELPPEYVTEQIVSAMAKLRSGSQNLNAVTIRIPSFGSL
jgi:RNA polymerase sigma-70 factor (ECF subfamily)